MKKIEMNNGKINIPIICVKEHIWKGTNNGIQWTVPIGVKGELRKLGELYLITITSELKLDSGIEGLPPTPFIHDLTKEQVVEYWMDSNNSDGQIDFNYLDSAIYYLTEEEYRNSKEVKKSLNDIADGFSNISKKLKEISNKGN
jgi:hypothetical protein